MRAFSLALAQAESPQEVGAQRRRDFSRRMARLAFRQRISISALNSDRVQRAESLQEIRAFAYA